MEKLNNSLIIQGYLQQTTSNKPIDLLEIYKEKHTRMLVRLMYK